MVASSRFFFQLSWASSCRPAACRELGVDRVGELLGVRQIGLAGLAPHHVGHFGIGQSARDRLLQAGPSCGRTFDVRSPVRKPLSLSSTSLVTRSAASASCARSRGWARRRTSAARRARPTWPPPRGGHQDLAAHVAALLDRGQLILEVHTRAPASIIDFISSNALRTPPKPLRRRPRSGRRSRSRPCLRTTESGRRG